MTNCECREELLPATEVAAMLGVDDEWMGALFSSVELEGVVRDGEWFISRGELSGWAIRTLGAVLMRTGHEISCRSHTDAGQAVTD
jgi:hypothetical protein